MKEIKIHYQPGSSKPFCRFQLDGKRYFITGDTEDEVRAEALLIRSGAKEAAKRPKKLTLKDAMEQYILSRSNTLSPSTIRGYRTIQSSRFLSVQQRDIHSMTAQDWQLACNNEAALCSPKTLKNAWGFVSSVLTYCTGSSVSVTLPLLSKKPRPYLTPAQIHVFLQAVAGAPCEIPSLLALCSLRRSEILDLRWQDIDLERNLITISGAAVMDEHGKLVHKETNKNESSQRVVPILIPQLSQALAAVPEEQRDGYLVHGGPNVLWTQINRVCEKADLPLVGVHGLRHSFASLAYHLGIPPKDAMQIGGWADEHVMHDIYTHIAQETIEQRVGQFRNFFSESSQLSELEKKDQEIARLTEQVADLQRRLEILSDIQSQFRTILASSKSDIVA